MKKIPLALGLYTLRGELRPNWKDTLKKVAQMGYDGVEFYGPMDYPVEELKAELTANKLTLVGWHIGFDAINEATISYNRALGNKRLVVPALPAEATSSIAAWRATAAKFCEAADYLAKEGFELGYHNHASEFIAIDGVVPWDVFAQATQGKVFLQLDNGNAMEGNADTIAYLKKYPGRGNTVHLKPYSKKSGFDTMIGEDDVPWIETFEVLDQQGVTEWYIVEYECEQHYTQLEGAKACIDALRKMGL